MTDTKELVPTRELVRKATRRFPNDSEGYRTARLTLLAEEIELRRHVERVAAQRRALPPGGEVPQDYVFQGPDGPVKLSELFGDKDTLVTYNWMFGTKRERSCPMCAALLAALDGEVKDIQQRVALAVFATSPIERMTAQAKELGWRSIPLYSSAGNDFNRDYLGEKPGEDSAGYNVFVRDGEKIRHSWGDEMTEDMADPGQDARSTPETMPLWTILDMTPGGRGTDWYPKLQYEDGKR
ncbi:MAG: DUF899 family protein [Deltaproteobacteria bacterium]|nr:DUF899 family protein [Nannocystaceae bacterium]